MRRMAAGGGRGGSNACACHTGGPLDARTVALDETGTPIKVQVQILDLTKVSKLVMDVILLSLLMQASDADDPALDGCERGWK